MILETIFTWLGGLLLISLLIYFIGYLWTKILNKWFNSIITVKALAYNFAYEYLARRGKEKPTGQAKLKLGSQWWTRFRGKRYHWECTKVEDVTLNVQKASLGATNDAKKELSP